MAIEQPERRLTAILAADVVGYSKMMGEDENGTLSAFSQLKYNFIKPLVSEYRGRIVNIVGDSILAEFASVVDAAACAVAWQENIGPNCDDVPFQFRIGLNLGDVLVHEGEIYGNGVNVAARLEGLADPDGICISQTVYNEIRNKTDFNFEYLGAQNVKNISRPIEAYRIDFAPEQPLSSGTIRFGKFTLDKSLLELQQSGKRVAIEPKAFDLLMYLAQNNNRTVTKEEIFAEVWNDRIVSDSALSSQIKAVRKVLGDNGKTQHTIRTIHGRGFRFIAKIDETLNDKVIQQLGNLGVKSIAALSGKPSVAILPFANLSGDASENYFADGITEDITTALSKNRWLTVIARHSAFAFRNSNDGIRTIGKALEADYLVTGSVRKVENRARITTDVVDVETENSMWSERFDRDMVDIFDLQDEITELVASRIEIELGMTEQRKAERRPHTNLGAWDLYQLGVAEFYKFNLQSNLKSQDLLRESLALDPNFASAYSRLAYAIVLSMVYFDVPPDAEKMDEALAAAERAIELDDQDANSYFTIGRVHLARQEYDLAIDALKYALELNPCLAVTYCGLGDSLAYAGRLDEAIEQFEIAIRLSPHDPFRWAFYSYRSLAHLFRDEFADAVSWARKSVAIPNAQYWASAHLVAALGHLGDSKQAGLAVAKLNQIKPEFSLDFAREHLFYLKRTDQIEMYLEGLKKAGVN